jgi:L-cysteine:1D-myo-inositol 2-amino-2-deoxy-alpha-D-glucopyranoside ligase
LAEASDIRLLDTLSGQKVPLPVSNDAKGPLVRIYVCGITPYDSGHLGHAFTFSMFDVLIRLLEDSGLRVIYVQNVTDVDDPLFDRARRDGVGWSELAERERQMFVDDMGRLGWRPPDFMPRVSGEIPEILDAVRKLNALGYAYRTDALYFDVSRYPDYGQLSHLSRRSMLRKLRDEGLLGRVGEGAKEDALDFPLWRGSASDEPAWPSEFGAGRPGWHIECSAMAMRYLGEQVDIHGGGRDLEFSHHESERAQSETLTGCVPFARAWLHTGMVKLGGKKMSKSLGNLEVVSRALERAPAAAVRLYLASHHYRRDWEFSWKGLDRWTAVVARLRDLLGEAPGAGAGPGRHRRPGGPHVAEFAAALADDLDTPRGLRALKAAIADRDAAAAAWMLSILAGTASLEPQA